MAKRIRIKWNWLMYSIVMIITGIVIMNTAMVNGEIIPEGWGSLEAKGAYRPYPILFLHGFAGGSNYTWNPDPNADNQAEEQKKPTAVLEKYFRDYFRVNLALKREGYPFTQFPYLETIEFFNSKLSDTEQLMDRNSSVDTFKRGDHYVVFGQIGKDGWYKKKEGDPGWADKVSYALRGESPHELSKYIYDDSPGIGGGPVLKNYLPPNATSFKTLLVCHSMGGLSAREYVTNSKYSNSKDNVAGIVTVGTPHLGSPLATAANAVSLLQFIPFKSKITWGTVAGIMKGLDVGLEWFGKIDPDGDAVNDMDPVTLLFFGNGYLGELASRTYPSNVPVRVIYSRFTPGMQLGIELQEYISKMIEEGIPNETIKEILEKALGVVIEENIISNAVGDGVVFLYSQQGIKDDERVFKLDKPIQISSETIKPEIEIRGFHGDEAMPAASEEDDQASALLKLIDYTKPRLEIASPQEGFIWESGVTITLEGKVYDEYLPADCSLKIELYKAGDNFNPVFSEIRKPDPVTGYTPLKPTTLWDPNKPSSPVAEFKEELSLPSGANPEATYTIKLTVLNPAGISSEPKQVTEKTWYMYGVAKDGSGVSKLWCIDSPASFADGVGAVVSEFELVDEQGQNISARPLDIATSGNTIWVSFDDRRIRRYNIYGEPEKVDTNWYWTATNRLDGLYYDGSGLQYCSSETDRLYRISSTGVETDLEVVKRRLSLDGVSTDDLSVNYTTQGYTGYAPKGISSRYLCSTKISKRDGHNIQTIPTGTPVWTNEQNAPAPVIGVVEVGDTTISGGIAIYLSCADGKVYKIMFEDKLGVQSSVGFTTVTKVEVEPTKVMAYKGTYPSNGISPGCGREQMGWWDWWNLGRWWSGSFGREWGWWVPYNSYAEYLAVWRPWWKIWEPDFEFWPTHNWGPIYTTTKRIYSQVNPPSMVIKAFVIHRTVYEKYQKKWLAGSQLVALELNPSTMMSTTYSICSYDENWSDEQKFNSPISTNLWTQSYNGTGSDPISELSSTIKVTDVTGQIPTTSFYYTGRYGDESQTFPQVISTPSPVEIPAGSIIQAACHNFGDSTWSFLTDEGSLETLDQFTAPSGIWEGIGTGGRINMRIKTGYPSSINIGGTMQLEAHGKESLAWGTSDENAGKVDSNGLFTAVGKGTCTVTVTDALGNVATSGVITVQ